MIFLSWISIRKRSSPASICLSNLGCSSPQSTSVRVDKSKRLHLSSISADTGIVHHCRTFQGKTSQFTKELPRPRSVRSVTGSTPAQGREIRYQVAITLANNIENFHDNCLPRRRSKNCASQKSDALVRSCRLASFRRLERMTASRPKRKLGSQFSVAGVVAQGRLIARPCGRDASSHVRGSAARTRGQRTPTRSRAPGTLRRSIPTAPS